MQILRDHGVEPTLVRYLETPPDEATLRDLSKKMGLEPKEFIRRNESIFKELALKNKLEDPDELFRQMAIHPRLIERPIIVSGENAILGRPPGRALEIL